MIVTTTAENLTHEYETTPFGEKWHEVLFTEATAAIAEKRSAAAAALFNDDFVVPSLEVLALFKHLLDSTPPRRLVDDGIAWHARALRSGVADFCRLLRSVEFFRSLEDATGSLGAPTSLQESHAEAQAKAAARARARFERAIAEQLVAAGGDLEVPARDLLAAELLADRLTAARARHEQAAAAAAARAETERRAAQDAADAAADEAQGVIELERSLVAKRLPPGLRDGDFAVAEMARCKLVATARRRLAATRVDGIRLTLGGQRGLYDPRDLARSITDATVQELQAVLHVLDVVDGRALAS